MKFLWNFWDGFCVNDPKCSCIASHLHFNNMFMHFRCVIIMLNCCVLIGLDWAELMMILCCMSYVHAFSCIRTFNSLYSFILFCWSFSNCLSLSFSFFLALVYSMEPKCKSTLSQNPLRSGASTSSFNPTPSHERFRDDKAWKDFSENFLDEAFIWIAKSSYRIFSILTFLLSSIVGVGGHCVTFRSLVPSWSYRSFTSICTNSILLYLISPLVFQVYSFSYFGYCICGTTCS